MSEGCLIYGAMQRALEYTNKPWIRQSFFRQCFKKYQFAKVFYRQRFLPYGISLYLTAYFFVKYLYCHSSFYYAARLDLSSHLA